MEYELTDERRAYLNARGHTILMACPGSGKTTSIVKKLCDVSRYCKDQYGSHAGFACLSFTNKACDELRWKYRELHGEQLSFPDEIATIDSFILQKVVLPFWYLCDACKVKPVVLNEEEVLDRVHYNNLGFPLPELRDFYDIIHVKVPSEVTRGRTGYLWKHNEVKSDREIAYCKVVFANRLERGLISSSDALWIACDILERHQNVAKALASRYPYIVVDEAQDNSELHFVFFDMLRRSGLQNLEFVGDICQSIYRFNGARPELLQMKIKSGEWNVLPLSECRRSNQRIIDLYSKLKSKDVPKIVSHGVDDRGIPIVVYKYDEENTSDIIRDFHRTCDDNGLESRMILARGSSSCKKLAGIKDVNFTYWKSELPYLLIAALFALGEGDLTAAFRKMRLVLAELKGGDTIELRRKYIQEMERNVDENAKIYTFLNKAPSLRLSFEEWSRQVTELLQKHWSLDERPTFKPFTKKKGYVMRKVGQEPVEKYYQSTDKVSTFYNSVCTIHAAKGASLDGILLFLSKDSKGQNISLKDFPQTEIESMTERQSLLYVACSRARQFLALAVPTEVRSEQVRQALSGVNLDIRDIG